jgi:glyoxylase-like metal-dependent hydrolase (beta-lactamase superfamily II)
MIHHLNCGTLRPRGGALVHGDGHAWQRTRLVTHVLLVETAHGLVLVDSGIGASTVDGRRGRLHARHLRMLIWAELHASEPAVHQVRALGFDPRDVRHIVLTHLDLDHAGGLADFPAAEVHVRADELDAATRRASLKERVRYSPDDWAHGPVWRTYTGGERWLGFEGAQPVAGLGGDVVLVPLPGHTRGHAGVAVRDGTGWMLHVGDALVFCNELEGVDPPRGIDLFTTHVASIDDTERRSSRDRLRAFMQSASRVDVVSSHDPDTFDRLSAARLRTAA